MTKHFWMSALVALTVLAPQSAYALTATVQQIQGEVLVHKTAGAADSWETVTQDTALENGDSLKTRKGTCVLAYSDAATFAVEENTSLTVEEKPGAQDIQLLLGKIKGKVNKNRAEQPFRVTTPAAVATVRGTEVDFAFNDEGQLTVDLHNGKIDVLNEEAELKLDLEGKKSIIVKYDKEANVLRVRNDCGSDGAVTFNILGADYVQNPCEEKEVALSTAAEGDKVPDALGNTGQENIQEGREPITEISQ
jgi:ferric-dicitrate binding protein FerR (iron transport regulator)